MTPPVYEISVQFEALKGMWTKVDMTPEVMLHTMKTGLYQNEPVAAIVLDSFQVTDQQVIYDIRAAKQGGQPWSLK